MKMFTELFQAMFQIPAYEGFLENRRRRVFGYPEQVDAMDEWV